MNIDEYDFLFNEDGELMLLLSGFEQAPKKPFLTLASVSLCLTRSDKMPALSLMNVPSEIMERLETLPHLLICELNEEGEPDQVYDAPIQKRLNA